MVKESILFYLVLDSWTIFELYLSRPAMGYSYYIENTTGLPPSHLNNYYGHKKGW